MKLLVGFVAEDPLVKVRLYFLLIWYTRQSSSAAFSTDDLRPGVYGAKAKCSTRVWN